MGLDDRIGSIEVGKQADFVVFDYRRAHLTPVTNALGNLVHVAQGRDVAFVAVDGELVVEDGRPTRVDEEAIRREAAQAIAALWTRARIRTLLWRRQGLTLTTRHKRYKNKDVEGFHGAR